MTTVAFRDGVMAADSQLTSSNCRDCEAVKIFDTNGWLLGWAGGASYSSAFVEWFKVHVKGTALPTPPPELIADEGAQDYNVLIVHKRTRAMYLSESGRRPYRIYAKHYTMGSGGKFATGAMEMGTSAVEAVRVAVKHDCSTGGRVRTLKCR